MKICTGQRGSGFHAVFATVNITLEKCPYTGMILMWHVHQNCRMWEVVLRYDVMTVDCLWYGELFSRCNDFNATLFALCSCSLLNVILWVMFSSSGTGNYAEEWENFERKSKAVSRKTWSSFLVLSSNMTIIWIIHQFWWRTLSRSPK